jgi:hypothetical protein
MSQPVPIGKGFIAEISEDGNTLVLTIDLTQDQGPSYSGKTQIVATTNGNIRVPEHSDILISVNAYRRPRRLP